MDTYTFKTYTAMDVIMESIPFLIHGQRNPAIPKGPGVYVLLQAQTIAYVGKTEQSLYDRLYHYTHEPTFTHVWCHVMAPWQTSIYELLYIHTLQPSLNGGYHHDRRRMTLAQRRAYDMETEQVIAEAVMSL